MPPCLIGMEACVGAHHLSRKLKALGHDARLMPQQVRAALLEGTERLPRRGGDCRGGATANDEVRGDEAAGQLDLQALHAVRDRFVGPGTGIINQIRACLLKRSHAVRQGQRFLRAELPRILATPPDVLSPRVVPGDRGPGK